MQRVVREQRLGFVATVTPDGRPSLSPKGTTRLFDDERLFFADIGSPGTVANLRVNPRVQVDVVDPIRRKVISPAYDDHATEQAISRSWLDYYTALHRAPTCRADERAE